MRPTQISVLPATTMFEIESYVAYGLIFRIREKLIEPLGAARNDYLIMAQLANRLSYGDRYPQSQDALLNYMLHGSGFTVDDVRSAECRGIGTDPVTLYGIPKMGKWRTPS